MKFSDALYGIGKPIAYYNGLAKPLGGAKVAIFFSQLFYWMDKTDNPLGVYKTQEEWEQETGLSRREQETARKKLRELGILIETNKRLEHRLYYRIDCEKLNEFMEELIAKNKEVGQCMKEASRNVQNVSPEMYESDIPTAPFAHSFFSRDYIHRLHTRNNPPNPLKGESADAEMSAEEFYSVENLSQDVNQAVDENSSDEKPSDGEAPSAVKKSQSSLKINYSAVAKLFNASIDKSERKLAKVAFPDKLSEKRKRKIKKMAEMFYKRVCEDWMQVFEDYFNDFFSNARDFYFGENNRGWRADFDFLLREDVFDKALEGNL